MRQHVNPLSKHFDEIERIPSLKEMFDNPKFNLHLDIGCAAGEFLFDLAMVNPKWNYLGIEIRERLVKTARLKVHDKEIKNLKSISFNFPDPWFKKRHNKRRVIQKDFINLLSNSMQKGSFMFIKTDVKDLFEYMDCTISSNLNFKKIDKKDFDYSESFNPKKVPTNREKYVIVNQLDIFESIYIKI